MTDIYLSMQAIFSGDNSDYLNLFVILGILSNVARQDCYFNADFVFSSDRTAGGPSRYSFVKTTDETSR